MMEKRKLFRTQALQHYAHNKQKDILPGFVAPPVFLMLWILLLIVVALAFFSWQEQIPTYTQASGIILEQRNQLPSALLFVPSSTAITMAPGQQITLHVNATGQQFQASVTSVDPGFITPKMADTKYQLTGDTTFVITQPSIVVHISLTPQPTNLVVAQMSINAQLQTGSRSLLSMVPDLLNNAFGG